MVADIRLLACMRRTCAFLMVQLTELLVIVTNSGRFEVEADVSPIASQIRLLSFRL